VPALTCYLIRDAIAGAKVRDFDDPLDLEEVHGRRFDRFGPMQGRNFTAQLFVVQGFAKEPGWADFLRAGFPDLGVPRVPSAGAILIVRVTRDRRARYLAFTFGAGRFLLRPDAWVRHFGMRTALNIIFEGDDGALDASRLRAIDAKRVEGNTVHTRRQANRRTTLETFEVDLRRDLLRSVDGRPVDSDTWGERIGGADALQLSLELELPNVGNLCLKSLEAHERLDYRVRFSWVDNVRVISDSDEIAKLEQVVIENLQAESLDNYELAPPEIIDWSAVAWFQYDFDRRQDVRRPEPRIADFVTGLRGRGRLDDLDVARLKRSHLTALSADGELVYRWPIWRCLSAHLVVTGGSDYMLDGGTFYEVAPDYLEEINAYLDALAEWNGVLPDATLGMREDQYNESAALSSPDYLLLDKQFVRTPERTSPIEVCDVLVRTGALVHVKKSWGASSLSHLFAQGAVSAELLLGLPEFRTEAALVIQEAERLRATLSSDQSFIGRFQLFRPDALSAGTHPVVFAIVGPWKGAGLRDKLPFFSKVNMRRSVERLQQLGFPVFHKRVPEV